MRVAIYPGSFDPELHRGHADVIRKALKAFDRVIVAKGINPDKRADVTQEDTDRLKQQVASALGVKRLEDLAGRVGVAGYTGLLKELVDQCQMSIGPTDQVVAIVRGVRGFVDLERERDMQYTNEDLGMSVPTFYVLTDRANVHISGTAIRGVNKALEIKERVAAQRRAVEEQEKRLRQDPGALFAHLQAKAVNEGVGAAKKESDRLRGKKPKKALTKENVGQAIRALDGKRARNKDNI